MQSTDVERKIAILTRLAEISVGLNSTMKLKSLLSGIMDAAAEITDAEAASVLLWDPKTNELHFAATTTSSSSELIGVAVPLEGSIAGTVMRENRVVVVNNVNNDPRHYSKLDEKIAFQTRSLIGVPMTAKNRLIGVLEAVNTRRAAWSVDDATYLSILASQAAVAIETAQMMGQLQKANQELSQVDKLKNDFIAIASHELRTPLGVILGYASFLQESTDEKVNEHASKVVNSALQLRRIIEDMTNLRYLQSGTADLHREPTLLKDLLHDLIADTNTLIETKHHHLTISDVPVVYVDVDRIRIGMALGNLLNNAIRFTQDGGRIDIDCMIQSPYVLISIRDNGIGIAPDQLERIFDKFYQVEDHMIRKYGGLGIGLSITKALIEAHGGRIWGESDGLGKGATFTIALEIFTK